MLGDFVSGRAATVRVLPGRYALAVGRPDLPAPKGWAWVPLTEVARLESGHTPSRSHPEYWNGAVPWVGIVDARDHHGREITRTAQTITEAGLANSAARMLPANTVCLVRTAGSIGHVTVLGRPMATSQDLVDWICGPRVDPWFLAHLFVAEKESLRSFSRGSAHPTIYFPEVKAFHVCLPPVGEQRRIVAKLESLRTRSRRAREVLEAAPALIDKLRQSILLAALRGDLTRAWRAKNKNVEPASKLLERIRTERRKRWEGSELAKMKAKGKTPTDDRWKTKYSEPEPVDVGALPELPKGWCWASVDELCPGDAPAVYGIILPGDDVPEGVPYVRPVDMRDDGTVDFASIKRTSPEIAAQYSRASLVPGDVVLSIVGTIGKVLVVPPELNGGNITQSSARIRPPSVMPSQYLALALQSPALTRQYDAVRFGNAVQRLNVEHVRRLAIPLAPERELTQVVRCAQSALMRVPESVVRHLRDRIDELDRSILAKAFRGELVPQDPNDELAAEMLAGANGAGATSNGATATGAKPRRTSKRGQSSEAT